MAEHRLPDLPSRVGPCEFGELGKLITVRCPKELAHILQEPAQCGVAAVASATAPHRASDPVTGARYGPAIPPRRYRSGR